jgi:hypothetical protein
MKISKEIMKLAKRNEISAGNKKKYRNERNQLSGAVAEYGASAAAAKWRSSNGESGNEEKRSNGEIIM